MAVIFCEFCLTATLQRNENADKEEEELQLAIAMSISSYEAKSKEQNSQPKSGIKPKSAQSLFQVRALYDFHGTEEGELHLNRGDIVDVYDCTTFQDWWKGSSTSNGTFGIFPANYVERIQGISSGASFPGGNTRETESDKVTRQKPFVKEFNERIKRVNPTGNDYAEIERLQVRPYYIVVAS